MHVEFLGVSRDRAGIAELEVEAETLGGLLGTLAARMPALAELIVVDALPPHDPQSASRGLWFSPRLHSSLAANLNGDRFISDPATRLEDGDRVLILSSDVGG
jgi:molybdopterin converting factor small subunit